ncbi:hypothetical protein CEXT_276251 [Caerostris extrusa]|uniref:Uncharacterized protein n=1 Tax=Caerostris extrusa TaxID=172846 RepID=A0AAV4XZK6_CAEEX|nr:hypothetical protein CEXT_276251 [Caerostris extrusa]
MPKRSKKNNIEHWLETGKIGSRTSHDDMLFSLSPQRVRMGSKQGSSQVGQWNVELPFSQNPLVKTTARTLRYRLEQKNRNYCQERRFSGIGQEKLHYYAIYCFGRYVADMSIVF